MLNAIGARLTFKQRPVAKLVPVVRKKRVLGSMRGLITPEKRWDAPIDDREAEEQFGL